MKAVELVTIGIILLVLTVALVFMISSCEAISNNGDPDTCFYSADSMVIQFETQRIRHLSDVQYRLFKEDILIKTETQPEFGGRIDDIRIFHVYYE